MQLPAVLKALRFNNRTTAELTAIPRAHWPALLRATDREGLTLPLGIRCRNSLSPLIAARIDHNLESNAKRHSRLLQSYADIAVALQSRNLEFGMLKGLTKSRYYVADLRYRPQYDIDIYLPEHSLEQARQAMEELGYEALPGGFGSTSDHLPRMIRKTGWRWREDYFDPEMPVAVELHFQFWNEKAERFSAGDLTPFWTRRVMREVAGLQLPALNEVDALTYSALHMMRHFFHGDLQVHHIYEMAHFLEMSAANDLFWNEWDGTGLKSCRTPEGIAFRLAAAWFHCSLHPAARQATEELPDKIQRWFELFPSSLSGKNELLLHLCLIPDSRDRRAVAVRRLLPVRQGRITLDAHMPPGGLSLRQRVRGAAYEAGFVIKRFAYHACALAATLWSGLRWTVHKRLLS